ncbi:MAG: hypothetical protein ACREC6_13820 [Hyphomicrobiaceae bacterium]
MKTQNMLSMLRALADLADAEGAAELRKFAGGFGIGKDEAVTARVKRILARRQASPDRSCYPATLRKSLAAIEAGLSASGARTQANDVQALLSLCEGFSSGSIEDFVASIAKSLTPQQTSKASRKKAEQSADNKLARDLAEELTKTILDEDAFLKIVSRLHDAKIVSTPTLGLVANRFLGNTTNYKGRKPAIDAILRRQKNEARGHARVKALDRISV